MAKDQELLKEVRRLRSVVRERDQMEVTYRKTLQELVESCGHVNISALNGTTVRDFRAVMKFMAACDAAKELLGKD